MGMMVAVVPGACGALAVETKSFTTAKLVKFGCARTVFPAIHGP
jgi:hypothetical protein